MPMRLEVGALTLEVERPEEVAPLLEMLFRYVNNKELGELLGVTDKTVRRWKREGRLPAGEGGPVTLLQLLQYLDLEPQPAPPTGGAAETASVTSGTAFEAPGDGTPGGIRPPLRSPRSSLPGARWSAPGSGP